jgi:hypothetical protein
MARLDNEFLGGFSGRLGPAVGYGRLGRWYVRALPRQVANPRTEAQQEHRAMFKQEVQLAAQMRWAVNVGMKGVAHQMGLTAQNLFVKANQQAFSAATASQEEMSAAPYAGRMPALQLHVDYPALQVSLGPVAPVAITEATLNEDNVLTVHFEKNPEHRAASAYDSVYLWIYSPAEGKGYLTNAVYRRAKRFDILLPEWLTPTPQSFGQPPSGRGASDELHLYAFVQDEEGRCSASAYGSANCANYANSLGQGVGDEEDGAGDEDEVLGVGGGAGGGDGLLDGVERGSVDAHLMGGGSEVGHG